MAAPLVIVRAPIGYDYLDKQGIIRNTCSTRHRPKCMLYTSSHYYYVLVYILYIYNVCIYICIWDLCICLHTMPPSIKHPDMNIKAATVFIRNSIIFVYVWMSFRHFLCIRVHLCVVCLLVGPMYYLYYVGLYTCMHDEWSNEYV